jgi:fermentation-respiration switch protein FrsA (DUF1100 family)
MKTRIYLLLFLLSGFSAAYSQVKAPEEIGGKWTGSLLVQNTKLRIVFNFIQQGSVISATLDSPDQGAKGIPVQEVIIRNDSIILEVPSIMGRYKAAFSSDTTMNGFWYQGGMSLPLDISKETIKHSKPLSVKNDRFEAREVKFLNAKANITLAGTLTIPNNVKKCPAVILVSGSGPQNRDEELMGQKPFLRIAEYLSSRGIAVLRYDDRGIAESTGDFHAATTFDFASDAEAAFTFLQKQPEINPNKIGIAGHSEGGLVAPVVASSNKHVAFLVLLAGPGIQGKEILITQTGALLKNAGLKPDTIQQIVALNTRLYNLLDTPLSDGEMIEKARLIIAESGYKSSEATILQRFQPILSPWFRTFMTIDPAVYLSQVECPVLALNGSNDIQVIPAPNIAGIEKALLQAKNKKIVIKELPGYNHLFQQSESGSISEYGNTSIPAMDNEVLEIITNWIQDSL